MFYFAIRTKYRRGDTSPSREDGGHLEQVGTITREKSFYRDQEPEEEVTSLRRRKQEREEGAREPAGAAVAKRSTAKRSKKRSSPDKSPDPDRSVGSRSVI